MRQKFTFLDKERKKIFDFSWIIHVSSSGSEVKMCALSTRINVIDAFNFSDGWSRIFCLSSSARAYLNFFLLLRFEFPDEEPNNQDALLDWMPRRLAAAYHVCMYLAVTMISLSGSDLKLASNLHRILEIKIIKFSSSEWVFRVWRIAHSQNNSITTVSSRTSSDPKSIK